MKIKRVKLNALCSEQLRQKELSAIVGGNSCGCSCAYEGNGGSSTSDNLNANYKYGYESNNTCNFTSQTEYGWEAVCRPKAS